MSTDLSIVRCPLLGRANDLSADRVFPRFRESLLLEVLKFFICILDCCNVVHLHSGPIVHEFLMSAIEGILCYVCMKGILSSDHVML